MRTVGSVLPFWYPWSPPEKATVVAVHAVTGQPSHLQWEFDEDFTYTGTPGDPELSLQAETLLGWTGATQASKLSANFMYCVYPAALDVSGLVRVFTQPATFYFADRLLRVPWRGVWGL